MASHGKKWDGAMGRITIINYAFAYYEKPFFRGWFFSILNITIGSLSLHITDCF